MKAVAWLWPCLLFAQDLKPEQAQALHAKIVPQADEQAWMQIPWTSDLWAARKLASEKGRPIFLWEMDGHPLGCV